MVRELDNVQYLPLEALVFALYDTGRANRPFLEVMREYPHDEPRRLAPFDYPASAELVPEMGNEGFYEVSVTNTTPSGRPLDIPVADIGWWPHSRGQPLRVAMIEFTHDPRFAAKWVVPAEIVQADRHAEYPAVFPPRHDDPGVRQVLANSLDARYATKDWVSEVWVND